MNINDATKLFQQIYNFPGIDDYLQFYGVQNDINVFHIYEVFKTKDNCFHILKSDIDKFDLLKYLDFENVDSAEERDKIINKHMGVNDTIENVFLEGILDYSVNGNKIEVEKLETCSLKTAMRIITKDDTYKIVVSVCVELV